MYDTVLIIGTGQIGKAILRMIVDKSPKVVVIHNLTKKESELVVKKYSCLFENIKFIVSYGNIFMPYKLKDLKNRDLYQKSDDIISYFYSEITEKSLENSTIGKIIKKYKPDIIIDAINTATVLGNAYNPEYVNECYFRNASDCCRKIMVDDYTTKLIMFIYSLKYAIEKYKVSKYVKVSTTGLGGMGINIPYTHGDNPKLQLSSALMGKISASGVLHQLLWNLSHVKGMNISLIIPSAFVGYDSVLDEPIETDMGLLKKRKVTGSYKLRAGDELKYFDSESDEYLKFPVVRAGENHVYSKLELNVLTAMGQMEAITKEEVANKVMDAIYGSSVNDILSSLDRTMLSPTYSGREMIYEVQNEINRINKRKYGIATGNLGVNLSKKLYELYIIKQCVNTIEELKKISTKDIVKMIDDVLSNDLIEEIISLGIPIIKGDNSIYIGDYSLVPSRDEDKIISEERVKRWSAIGWVDLRFDNINIIKRMLIDVYNDAINENRIHDFNIYKNFKKITNDYDIAEYLAYYYNYLNKGRKK